MGVDPIDLVQISAVGVSDLLRQVTTSDLGRLSLICLIKDIALLQHHRIFF